MFRPKFKNFYFCTKLCYYKFEGVDFKYDNSFLKSHSKNTQSLQYPSLQLYKFEGTDFKYDNSIFK